MLLNLTEFSREPVHGQIARQIWEKMLEGDLAAGAELPPPRRLARRHHLGVHTVERAYRDLAGEGLISNAGNGFVVACLTAEQKREIARRSFLGRTSPLEAVQAFSRQLASVFEPAQLCRIFRENLRSHMQVQGVHFVLRDAEGLFALLPGRGFPARPVAPEEGPLLDQIAGLPLPTRLNEIPLAQTGIGLAAELAKRKVQIVYPLKDSERFLGFIALSEKISGLPFQNKELGVVIVLANQLAAALVTAGFHREAVEKRRMEGELRRARQIQQDLLPKKLPYGERAQVDGFCEPCRGVGGDFYDCLPIDADRFGLVVGDACGKGLPAAMLISQIQAILKGEAGSGKSIQGVMRALNRHIHQFTSDDNFSTLFYAVFDPRDGRLEYANAGHNPAILLSRDGRARFLEATGLPLGILADADCRTESVVLRRGDCLLIYSDGVTETRNGSGKEYGLGRLREALARHREGSAREIVQALGRDLDCFNTSGQWHDDRTLLLLKAL